MVKDRLFKMSLETEIRELKRDIKIIKSHVIKPKTEISLGKWISGTWLTKITGWDHREKRLAREQNLVEYKKENGSYLYLLSSIPNEFKKIA